MIFRVKFIQNVITLNFALLALLSSFAYSNETDLRLENPFLLPQTNFYLGNINYYTIQLTSDGSTSSTTLNSNSINFFGFDLEVNHSRYMNIGAYIRVESMGNVTGSGITSIFSTLLGGFTRFYYIPPFLNKRTVKTSLFLRLELGGGPIILGIPCGLVLQPGVHAGIEHYFNKWFGLSFSYGQVFDYGKVTLLGNSTIWNQAEVFQGAVKTTFF